MALRKIAAGTKFYITGNDLNLRLGDSYSGYQGYVLYDIRFNGFTIIPKGTRVTGEWVTDLNTQEAQLQVNQIYLERGGQEFYADSEVIKKKLRSAHQIKPKYGNRYLANTYPNNLDPSEICPNRFIQIEGEEIMMLTTQDFISYGVARALSRDAILYRYPADLVTMAPDNPFHSNVISAVVPEDCYQPRERVAKIPNERNVAIQNVPVSDGTNRVNWVDQSPFVDPNTLLRNPVPTPINIQYLNDRSLPL